MYLSYIIFIQKNVLFAFFPLHAPDPNRIGNFLFLKNSLIEGSSLHVN